MRPVPLALLGLLSIGSLSSAAPLERPLPNGVFVGPDGVSAAEVRVEGVCEDVVWLHVTLHRPSGRQEVTLPYASVMLPEACWVVDDGAPRCDACAPLAIPFAWALQDPEGDSHLAGGGYVVYDRYTHYEGTWTLQGPFLDGHLEFHNALPDWP